MKYGIKIVEYMQENAEKIQSIKINGNAETPT